MHENAQKLQKKIYEYSLDKLQNSKFHTDLSNLKIDIKDVQKIYTQFYKWRNEFHTWFGLLIAKSGSIAMQESCVQAKKDVLEAFSAHIVAEMRDDHDTLYIEFLQNLGMNIEDIASTKKTQLTQDYIDSFLNRHFDQQKDDFLEMCARIAGREMSSCVRNTFVINNYFKKINLKEQTWWDAHERLELVHFIEEIKPLIVLFDDQNIDLGVLIKFMKAEIDLHIAYWDELYQEIIK